MYIVEQIYLLFLLFGGPASFRRTHTRNVLQFSKNQVHCCDTSFCSNDISPVIVTPTMLTSTDKNLLYVYQYNRWQLVVQDSSLHHLKHAYLFDCFCTLQRHNVIKCFCFCNHRNTPTQKLRIVGLVETRLYYLSSGHAEFSRFRSGGPKKQRKCFGCLF